MKKYDAYKDSGIEWLGEIPEHWKVVKVKHVLKNLNSFRVPLSSVERANMKERIYDYYGASGVIDKVENYIFEGENILIGEDGANLLSRSKRLAFIASGKYWVNNHAHILKPREGNITYFSELMEIYDYTPLIVGAAQPKLTQDSLMNIEIIEPPISEQNLIAFYLNHKTTQIDTLIEKKEHLVEKLTLKRQAIINEAVTKGLNPDVPMKDSGIEWLGEIPEHWELTSVKNILDIPITDGPHTTPELYDEGIPFISAEAIKEGKIDFERKRGYISKKDYIEYSKKYLPNLYDIYMVKSGATTGNIAMVETDNIFTIWSPLAVFRANSKKMHYAYLYNFLESAFFKYQVELNWSYGTQQNIGMGVLSNLKIIYPDVSEQKLICNAIKIKTNHIDTLVKQINTSIEKLKLYRQSLISEAVTGKVDLRDWKQIDNK